MKVTRLPDYRIPVSDNLTTEQGVRLARVWLHLLLTEADDFLTPEGYTVAYHMRELLGPILKEDIWRVRGAKVLLDHLRTPLPHQTFNTFEEDEVELPDWILAELDNG